VQGTAITQYSLAARTSRPALIGHLGQADDLAQQNRG
jgi:hypothetical protein